MTDVEGVRAAVDRCGAENVLCVVTTTSCFAPRLPDKVKGLRSEAKSRLRTECCSETEGRC